MEKGGLSWLASPLFEGEAVHAFLTRKGGVSAPPFDTLNAGIWGEDEPESVAKNLAMVSSAFGFDRSRLVIPRQVHGDNVLVMKDAAGDNGPREPAEADAVTTDCPGLAIGVLTADCVPILLLDPENRAIAAVHAGWKGTLMKIAGKTINAMRERFGSMPSSIQAVIGPHIGACCYAVGEDVVSEFRRRWGADMDFMDFMAGDGRTRLRLSAANRKTLLESGLLPGNISEETACTSCRNDLFFSYRKEGPRTGRQLSFIML